MFYGLPGSLNDLNILDKSTTIGSILEGAFPPRMKYTTNGAERYLMYLLADGIYPQYAIFLRTISGGGNGRRKRIYRGHRKLSEGRGAFVWYADIEMEHSGGADAALEPSSYSKCGDCMRHFT